VCALSDAIRERASLQSEERRWDDWKRSQRRSDPPTRRCNLRCNTVTRALDAGDCELSIDSLERFLVDVAQEGFNGVGISGGEPLIYRDLPRLLSFARSIGLQTSVTTTDCC